MNEYAKQANSIRKQSLCQTMTNVSRYVRQTMTMYHITYIKQRRTYHLTPVWPLALRAAAFDRTKACSVDVTLETAHPHVPFSPSPGSCLDAGSLAVHYTISSQNDLTALGGREQTLHSHIKSTVFIWNERSWCSQEQSTKSGTNGEYHTVELYLGHLTM